MGNPETSLLSSVSVWDPGFLLSPVPPPEDPPLLSYCSAFTQRWKHSFNSRTTRFWWGCVATARHLTCSMITPQVSSVSCALSCVFVPVWLQFPSLLSPELYRISTFARFPTSGVTERSLARAGWFYTGVGDRVQCFKCNVTAEGWQAGDCPTEKHRQLSPSCSFIQSLPSTSNLLSSSHSAFSPLRIAPAIPVRSTEVFFYHLIFIFYLVICFYL